MDPADQLLSGAGSITVTQNRGRAKHEMGAQVLAKPGEVYAIYFPTASATGRIDLSAAKNALTLRWFNPRNGRFEGDATTIPNGTDRPLGPPPADAEQDWVALIK